VIEKKSIKKILIIQTASIGDVILATPLIESLNQQFTNAEIDILIKSGNESLFYEHPFLNQIIVWNKNHQKYRNLFGIVKQIRKQKYDYIINIQRFFSSGLITALSGAAYKVGFNKNPFSFLFDEKIKHRIGEESHYVHETERNLDLIKPFCKTILPEPKLYPSKNDYKKISEYKSYPYICIAPGSLWATKKYPVEKWVEFIREVPESTPVYLIGSKQDIKDCEEIIKKSERENMFSLSGDLTLLETTALMEGANMNYTNDSAPMHLASSVDAKVTVLFCSTIPAFGFGPLSTDSAVVETHEKLDCRPCGLHGLKECPEKHFKCAMTIQFEDLLKRIE